MNTYFLKIGVIGTAMGGIFIYSAYDRAANYKPVDARITSVKEKCYLKRETVGVTKTTTETTREMDCDIAVRLSSGHPEYRGTDVIRTAYVEVKYRSPVDGRYYRKTQEYKVTKKFRFRTGQPIKILAHLEDPKRIQKF